MLRKTSPAVALVTACAVALLMACPMGSITPSFAAPADQDQEVASTADEDAADTDASEEEVSTGTSEDATTEADTKSKKSKKKKISSSEESEADGVGDAEEVEILEEEEISAEEGEQAQESSSSVSASKAIAEAEASRDRAGDAASKLSALQAQLADVHADYEKAKKETAKAEKKLKKLKKKVKKAKKQAARAKAVVEAVAAELENSSKVGLLSVVAGCASFDDIDSRTYLLQIVSQDQKDTVTRLEKLQVKQKKIAKKIKKSVKEQRDAAAEVKRLGNKIAFEIEKQTSAVRVHDDAAESAVANADESDETVAEAKRDVKAAASNHDSARRIVDASVGDWYELVDSSSETDGALSFGEGEDFTLDEEEFVAKWSTAIDAFFGARPLGGYGEAMAKAAYKYKIDPRLCAAVSIIESSGGIHCIRPHNAWGWGAADSDPYNLASEWGSWEDAIEAWHEGMATSKTGLATAKTLDELGSIYCSTADWSANVATEMEKISELAAAAAEDMESGKSSDSEDASSTEQKADAEQAE